MRIKMRGSKYQSREVREEEVMALYFDETTNEYVLPSREDMEAFLEVKPAEVQKIKNFQTHSTFTS